MKERFLRAMPTTFAVHLAQTVLAVFAASVWSAAFAAALGGHAEGLHDLRTGGTIAVEAIGSFLKTHAGWALGYTALVALGWWLVSIPLQMVWLHAHEGPLDRAAILRALGRSLPALGASLLMVVPLVGVLIIAGGLPWAWVMIFGDDPDPRVLDLGALLALIPGFLLALLWAAWLDVARAAVALGLAPMAAIRAGWTIRSAHLYAAWWLLGLILSLVAVGLGGPGWLMLLGAQLALVARTYARSAWWSTALARLSRSPFLAQRE